MRTTRLAGTAGALAAGILVLTGCSGASSTNTAVAAATDISSCTPSEHTLDVTFGSQAAAAMKIAVANLQTQYPGLTVNAEPLKTASYDELTNTVVADIAVGKRPDLIMSGLGQLRFWVEKYSPATIDTAGLADTYQSQFLTAGTVDGKVYLAPAQVSAPVLLVNQTMLDASNAGNATDIRTFDDVVTAAATVTAKTGKPSVSLPTQGLSDWLSQGFVQGAGGTFVNADGTAGFGDATGIDALSLWTKLNERGLEARINEMDAISAFASQQTALAFTTTSLIASMTNTVGNGFEWTAVDFPTVNGGDGLLPAGGNGWIVLSDDGCRAAYANALVAELLGTEAVLAASGTDYSYIPVDKAAAEQLLSTGGLGQPKRYAWTYDKELSPWGGFDGAMTKQINDVLRQMTQGLQSGSELEPTVKQAVTTIDAIVGQG
ncbi:extracellular solute-binding protein [Prescottella agglutinans]|uniref:extracellular solute-binding protein n=1 Tax=Prescottella agglutinans TaxID=1644129 RepID=UPI003D993966